MFRRQSHDAAKRGMNSYEKALSFAAHKWNLKTDSAIESGTTEDDVVQYVRERLCKLQRQKKGGDNISPDEDSIAPDNEYKDAKKTTKKMMIMKRMTMQMQ